MDDISENDQEPMLYELAYLLDPSVPEERLAEEAGKITGAIEKHGGTIVLADNPKIRSLSYTIERPTGGKRQKYNQGYFGWIKFTVSPFVVEAIDGQVKQMAEVIRHMLTHTVKSVNAYMPRRRPVSASTEGEAIAGEKPTEAELDKEVEKLIASASQIPITQ